MVKPKNRPPFTPPASLRDAITRLLKDTDLIRGEIYQVKERLKPFTSTHKAPERPYFIRDNWYTSDETNEPRSAIQAAIWELEKVVDIDPATRAFFGALTDLEGALLDIRKVRRDIETIAEDAGLKDDFGKFMKGRR